MTDLSHIDDYGNAKMVDVSDKTLSNRVAVASALVQFPKEVFIILKEQGFAGKKGSIAQTAIIAGIQAAKRTAELIPLCHTIPLSKIDITIYFEKNLAHLRCTVKCQALTGVEMEALTGVTVAALTIYDMCKALSHDIYIKEIKLEEKSGGKKEFLRNNGEQ